MALPNQTNQNFFTEKFAKKFGSNWVHERRTGLVVRLGKNTKTWTELRFGSEKFRLPNYGIPSVLDSLSSTTLCTSFLVKCRSSASCVMLLLLGSVMSYVYPP